MSHVEAALAQIATDLDDLGQPWALVGGLAVSARAEPRTTRDVDVAVAIRDDAGAEALVHALTQRGYEVRATVEQTAVKRMATARLSHPKSEGRVMLDLLFASSGVEPEIVAAAERIAILPGLEVPVARIGHLIAMKVLARDDRERPQDADDIRALLAEADDAAVEAARETVRLIEARGFHRGRALSVALEAAIADESSGSA